jgi:tetratricopeptide (TPR) repeat protein
MSKLRRQPGGKEDDGRFSYGLFFAGALCLAIGFGAGYYFGRRSIATPQPAVVGESAAPAPDQAGPGSRMNPAAFLQAEASLRAALGSNPRDLQSIIRLGNLYYDQGQYRQAVDWYGRALELDPANVDVRTDRGTCYWNLGQPDPAIEDFQRSLAVSPDHPQTLFNLGIVLLHGKSDPDGARKSWERLLAANPNYPERSQVEQQLATLSKSEPAIAPQGEAKPGIGGMENLLERLKRQ